jgi:hypothetical protein
VLLKMSAMLLAVLFSAQTGTAQRELLRRGELEDSGNLARFVREVQSYNSLALVHAFKQFRRRRLALT